MLAPFALQHLQVTCLCPIPNHLLVKLQYWAHLLMLAVMLIVGWFEIHHCLKGESTLRVRHFCSNKVLYNKYYNT